MESYAYGENGARSLETNALRGVADKAYAYAEDHRLQSAGDTSYTYDADGFLQSKTTGADVTQYAYASTGELLSVHLPDGRLVEYENDALGRRAAKKIDGTIVEKYLWLGRTRLLAVFNADGSLKYRFNYADGRLPVSMAADGQTYYLAYDQVGSLRAVTDANGLVVKLIEYDSFGNVLEDTNSALDVPFGFAGGLYDADTGLVRFGFRDYDAEVGRWTAKDPIGFGGGDSDLYGYCGGDPVNYVDLDGTNSQLLSFFGQLIEEAISAKIQDDVMNAMQQAYIEKFESIQKNADELHKASVLMRENCLDSCDREFGFKSGGRGECPPKKKDCIAKCLKEVWEFRKSENRLRRWLNDHRITYEGDKHLLGK